MTTDTIYLIDGHAYIYRAYHAIAPLTNAEGLPTHAAFGFTNILNRVIKDKDPRFLAVAFDAKGPTFRHDLYREYKANRPPMPEDLRVQIPFIHEIVDANRILTLEREGLEADDLIAAAAVGMAAKGFAVVIVSGDKDLLQLVGPGITLWDPMKDVVMDETAVEKKYGVPPARLTDLFALIGDNADNVPGVPGVGIKTAAKLLADCTTIEEIYQNIDSVRGKKLKEKLLANHDLALLSRRLIRLDTTAPVPLDSEAYQRREPDNEALGAIFKRLGFKRLTAATQTTSAMDTSSFRLIEDQEALAALIDELRGRPYIVLDTETTSLDPLRAKLVGISLCAPEVAPCYLPTGHRSADGSLLPGQLDRETVSRLLGPLLVDEALPKVGHNLKYDLAVLRTNGFSLNGPLWDTMLASYLLDPVRRGHKLDDLAAELLGIKMTPYNTVTAGKENFADVVPGAARDYSCEDVACTLALWQRFEPELEEKRLWPLFAHVEARLIPILEDMERAGIGVDTKLLQQLSTEFEEILQGLSEEIHALAGGPFNINSPKQLAAILFDRLGLPKGRKTKTGYSTDIKVLERLAAKHKLPALIIEHRNIAKLKSTYVDKLGAMVHPDTGRLHTSFNQTVTATGRLSSSEPNLQNIPIRTPEGRRIRAAFVPAAGQRFLSADYSQIDLRVLAHYSEDPALIEAFHSGDDIHRRTAAEIFRIDPGRVTGDMRRVAKSINFGIVYGMSAFGLANQLRIGRKEAATFIDRYFEHYQGVKRFMEEIVEQARTDGYVTTLLGRRRQLPDILAANRNRREFAERTALNTPIQGTAADIIKLAAIACDRELRQAGRSARLLLQIHDELIWEVPEEEIEETREIVTWAMEGVLDLRVPLVVQVSVGDSLAK